MGPFIDPTQILAILLMVLGGGVRDLASCVTTDTYWKYKNVTVSMDQLVHELDEVKPAEISKLIDELDSDDPKTRDAASAKIAAVGPAAIPALDEASKSGSPEVMSRARSLLANIRASGKPAAVRRLMAIRTLGEKKDPAALKTLRSLLESKELFEADYAKAAIANIEGKPYAIPVATEQDRAADVGLMPARLDMVAQVAPEIDGKFSLEALLSQAPGNNEQKNKARDEATKTLLEVLDEIGNIRLNSLTWGFYAAPPTIPGNTMAVASGEYHPPAVVAALGHAISKSKKVDGIDVFELDEDTAILVTSHGRIAFVTREPGGELGVEAMAAALRKGVGDLSTNADLSALIKATDTKVPLWAAAKISVGMKEVVVPFQDFDTITLSAKQSQDNDKTVNDIRLEAKMADAAKAKAAIDSVSAQMKAFVAQGREEEKTMPTLKPFVDFVDGLKFDSASGTATMSGSLGDSAVPVLPMIVEEIGMRRIVGARLR